MQALNLIKRIIKILGKIFLGLLILFILLIAAIHLPPVQTQITRQVESYLSAEIEAEVDIQRISFSLLGFVNIHDLVVRDPQNNRILSAREIGVRASVLNLLRGNLIIDELRLSGFDGDLVQSESGLNIQFILDAFSPAERQDTVPSGPIKLQFHSIHLEAIRFAFSSAVNGTAVAVNLGTFTVTDGVFSTHPTTIQAEKLFLQNTVIDILSAHHPDTIPTTDTTQQHYLLLPDFGSGIALAIGQLELDNNDFSFHHAQVEETRKFDPEHITLKNIQISVSDIVMRDDRLDAKLHTLSAQLPRFTLVRGQADVRVNKEALFFSNVQLASGTNELQAELTLPNDFSSANNTGEVRANIQLQVEPSDLEYFLTDSTMNQFRHWGPSTLTAEAFYSMGEGEIKSLSLKTSNSAFHVAGKVYDVFDLDAITWNHLVVNATIGSDFRQIITPFLQHGNVPPQVTLQLNSSGNPKDFFAEGKVLSAWGNVVAQGHMIQELSNWRFDGKVIGEQVDLGKWMTIAELGPIDLTAEAKGMIGDEQLIEVNGLISKMEILDQHVQQIAFQTTVLKDSAAVTVSITDPNYRSEVDSRISFAGPLSFTNSIQFDKFMLGKLLHTDSTLTISGDTRSTVIIGKNSLEGMVDGKHMFFHKQSFEYSLDSLNIHAILSPTRSEFTYYTDYAKAHLVSNFDIREAADAIQNRANHILNTAAMPAQPSGTRTAGFSVELEDASVFKLLDIDVDEFTVLRLTGEFDEQEQKTVLHAASGKFKGYGISLDTMNTNLEAHRDGVTANMNMMNLLYDSIHLGNLDFDILTKGDTAVSTVLLTRDTITLLGLRTRILPTDSGVFIYPDNLRAFDNTYFIDPEKPVFVGNNNAMAFNYFTISREAMEIGLDGNVNAFDVSFRNVDLTPLNFFLSPDTTVVHKGHLTGQVSYMRNQQLNLKADIDSLILYNSSPLTIAAHAVSDGSEVPFEFLLTSTSNVIDLKGIYFSDNTEIDANLMLNVNDPEMFEFLVSDVIDDMHGTIKGKTNITGPISRPSFMGSLHFKDVSLTTVNPVLTFNVKEDSIVLDHSSLRFNRFTLYDEESHPLTIDGHLTVKDNLSIAYDLQINSEAYTLINHPDSTSGMVRGLLVIDSDIKLKGDDKDKTIDANLTIKNATALTFVTSSDNIDLLTAEGVVDFVDPALLLDSAALEPSINFYDSLIATLPDFNLNARVTIEEDALFRLLIDEQSGDYLEASGGAKLELNYDRTGNLQLAGNYTIRKGVYRLSFYDLVKKNFDFVQGSAVTWSGNPKNGDLNIKAVHTVASNSIGLIGHEIGENEKSIYKRSLNYQVGINIDGTIEKPIITFSLDLPQNEKTNYPVLANKLDRLRQPEYESELNKQVFGLLVLGGFLPETSGSDINSSAIATTALANSVNSLLASQLNRFANQYIKGVNIDVGIQSYSDYSAPGGKTQTAMDFRVSKSIMNDRLSFEIGGDFNLNQDQSGANTGTKNYRGDIAIIYDLTGNGDKQLKLFNNETYDIVYQEIRNTGISIIFIRDFDSKQKIRRKQK